MTIEPSGHKKDLQIPLMKVNSFTTNPEVTGFRKETEEAKPRKQSEISVVNVLSCNLSTIRTKKKRINEDSGLR